MPVLYRLVHMPHTNVPHSFEYINRLLCHLGNFKFNLYADKLWKFTDFHCVFSVTRRLLMRSFLAQLQPLYHTSRESGREGAMQAQAVAINLSFVFFASLSHIPESDSILECVVAAGFMGLKWIFHPLFGLISCFLYGYESISSCATAIPFTYSKWKPSIDDFMAFPECVSCAIHPYLLFRLSSHFCLCHG